MKLFFKEPAFCAVFLLGAATGAGAAESPNLHISLETGLVSQPVLVVPDRHAHSCEASGNPVKIDMRHSLQSTGFDLLPFVQTLVPSKKVIVRRAGKIAEDQEESPARFTRAFVPENQQAEAVDVELSAKLLFCEYAGFPEFVGAVYTLSGQVGNFRIFAQDAIEPKENNRLTLIYHPRDARKTESGSDEPLGETAGLLEIKLSLKDLAAESRLGQDDLLTDVSVFSWVEVTPKGTKP